MAKGRKEGRCEERKRQVFNEKRRRKNSMNIFTVKIIIAC